MTILSTFLPVILLFSIFFSAPLFHAVLAGVRAVGGLLPVFSSETGRS